MNNENILFGIVMPTYEIKKASGVNTARANYTNSPAVLTDAINSIKNQTYKNWKLYIVGDCYENVQELTELLSNLLKPSQYTFVNLRVPGERDRGFSKMELRNTGGCAALNKSLDLCAGDNITYVARLDHDDVWSANHLEILATAYIQYPNLAFAFTQSRKKSVLTNPKKEYMMMPDNNHIRRLNNIGYVQGKTGHSSVSWRLDLISDLRYRDPLQQLQLEPMNSNVIAADMDMFRRMMRYIKSKKLQYMYIPILTNYHRNRKGEY